MNMLFFTNPMDKAILDYLLVWHFKTQALTKDKLQNLNIEVKSLKGKKVYQSSKDKQQRASQSCYLAGLQTPNKSSN